jgi:hypothetical protein
MHGWVSTCDPAIFSPTCQWDRRDIQHSWILSSSGVCARSLVRRTYIRTATGELEERTQPRTHFPLWRAGDGDGTGYWDVAQNHTRIDRASRQVTLPEPSPSRDPDDVGELSSMFHPRR